jgi:hypothetical protein
MSFFDYLPSPKSGWETLVAPFKSREGQPYLQGVARNFGHAAFGDKIGNAVDQRLLGDVAPGTQGPVTGMSAQLQPQPGQMQSSSGQDVMQLMQALMKHKGGM